MKNIRYAFASVSYHKKISFGIGICSAFFLFLTTSILNLIDMEKILHDQVSNLPNISDYLVNYHKIIKLYSSLYLAVLFIWVVLTAVIIFISLRVKEQDMLKWRIMGFSKRFVIKQLLWENLIPIIVGMFTAAVFLLVCQHTYEFILMQIRPLITDGLGIKRVAFFSSNFILESTPNQMVNTIGNTHFLSIGISGLPVATIFRAFLKNCFALLSITTGITLLLSSSFSKKTKKVFRM
ncbi:hypothetical protein DOK67_0002771 [Enterococcus sp. DIV0212c]|nr:hypothetical protein [Enterococcus sp. DIV0212c]MBO1353300.1 hypothetical protein [Enterococcus sp. DIV0212c]